LRLLAGGVIATGILFGCAHFPSKAPSSKGPVTVGPLHKYNVTTEELTVDPQWFAFLQWAAIHGTSEARKWATDTIIQAQAQSAANAAVERPTGNAEPTKGE
jgi:hypothetical protein